MFTVHIGIHAPTFDLQNACRISEPRIIGGSENPRIMGRIFRTICDFFMLLLQPSSAAAEHVFSLFKC